MILYPHILHQRCAFHKLQNLWSSIHTPEGLTRQERTDFKLQLLHPLQTIFYADDEADATQLRDCFIDEFESDQSALVATLPCDWHETIAFFSVLDRFPT